MSNAKVTDSSIEIHGRGSLSLPFAVKASNGTAINISAWTVFFEVDGVPIREQLVVDPNNATGLLLILERTQVATLKKTACAFSMVDETNGVELANVLWTGTIARTGYVGTPDAVDG